MAALGSTSYCCDGAHATISSCPFLPIRPCYIHRPNFCGFLSVQPILQSNNSTLRKSFPFYRRLGFQIVATATEAAGSTEEQLSENQPIKDFLDELKSVGRIRIIVNTGVGVLESVTSLEKLFYHATAGRGEYANLMNKDENVDFHLLLDKVRSVKFAKGKSMVGDIPTYMIRFLDEEDKAAALFLVMWKPETRGEYDPGQVEAFEALLAKYGESYHFKK